MGATVSQRRRARRLIGFEDTPAEHEQCARRYSARRAYRRRNQCDPVVFGLSTPLP